MFMKNLFKVLTVCTVAVMTLSSCNCFTKMAKNQDDIALTCVPEVLVLNNGKVDQHAGDGIHQHGLPPVLAAKQPRDTGAFQKIADTI